MAQTFEPSNRIVADHSPDQGAAQATHEQQSWPWYPAQAGHAANSLYTSPRIDATNRSPFLQQLTDQQDQTCVAQAGKPATSMSDMDMASNKMPQCSSFANMNELLFGDMLAGDAETAASDGNLEVGTSRLGSWQMLQQSLTQLVFGKEDNIINTTNELEATEDAATVKGGDTEDAEWIPESMRTAKELGSSCKRNSTGQVSKKAQREKVRVSRRCAPWAAVLWLEWEALNQIRPGIAF